MGKRIDLVGMVFGRLTVISQAGRDKYNSAVWKCRCGCGNEKDINGASLRNGLTSSCGCIQKEVAAKLGTAWFTTHGKAKTPTHSVWMNMLTRCTNPNYKQWADYGGRGITVCERWRKFENFLADMGERPQGTTLDRVDNDKGYSPENCRWATGLEQSVNKRNTLVWNGKTIKQWEEELGVNYYTLQSRMKRFGTLFPEDVRVTSLTPKALK